MSASERKVKQDFVLRFVLSCAQSAKLAQNGRKRAQMSVNERKCLRSVIFRGHERKRAQLSAKLFACAQMCAQFCLALFCAFAT